MRRIVYYVACSIDGFISGPNDDVSGYVGVGNGVEKYLGDLASFDTVIMGRNTYEYGYKFGIEPGQPAYPNMTHYIFSNNLTFNSQHEKVQVKPVSLEEIDTIKRQSGSDIYLCGGGQLAGWLLDHQQIDILRIKLSPLILGQGVKLFGDSKQDYRAELLDSTVYDHGLQIMTYKLNY
ncbi:dihydrofolate reductase family protein [Spirosoma sp.]|uniref:dihydrofolate reductase family protein n=1 Tax=Spirosoma sp. TaxID=1899569 RepID=UPI003B3A8DF6